MIGGLTVITPVIRLDDNEYFVGQVMRIGSLKSLFPKVRHRAPSILVEIVDSNREDLTPGNTYRFTFFNPSLMRQWDGAPANLHELVRIDRQIGRNSGNGNAHWGYSVSERPVWVNGEIENPWEQI